MRPELLTAGFKLVQQQSLEVTDDVSIIEALGKPVKITYGSYSNIKVLPKPPVHLPAHIARPYAHCCSQL